jgi:peptide-methionine (S)-S-oxide reductase
MPNPTYAAVCDGNTGHAEAVRLHFDPAQVSFRELLQVFFAIHDPTTLNRQGNDVGTQYRSAIYCHDAAQRDVAEAMVAELERDRVFARPIVTEVVDAAPWYPAEAYHQNYFRDHPGQGYCMAVVAPKLAKFRKLYATRLKSNG